MMVYRPAFSIALNAASTLIRIGDLLGDRNGFTTQAELQKLQNRYGARLGSQHNNYLSKSIERYDDLVLVTNLFGGNGDLFGSNTNSLDGIDYKSLPRLLRTEADRNKDNRLTNLEMDAWLDGNFDDPEWPIPRPIEWPRPIPLPKPLPLPAGEYAVEVEDHPQVPGAGWLNGDGWGMAFDLDSTGPMDYKFVTSQADAYSGRGYSEGTSSRRNFWTDLRDVFFKADLDGDGKISKAEAKKLGLMRGDSKIRREDINALRGNEPVPMPGVTIDHIGPNGPTIALHDGDNLLYRSGDRRESLHARQTTIDPGSRSQRSLIREARYNNIGLNLTFNVDGNGNVTIQKNNNIIRLVDLATSHGRPPNAQLDLDNGITLTKVHGEKKYIIHRPNGNTFTIAVGEAGWLSEPSFHITEG